MTVETELRGSAPGYPDSYYAASARATPARSALDADIQPEVCVVGAGYTGLSAALELAERGHEVVVLEAERVGWGASGRNGGQIVNGLNASLDAITRRYGRGVADFVGSVVQEGGQIIRDRVAEYGIDCDLKDGNIFAALTGRQMRELEGKLALWRGHGHDNFEMLDRAALREHVGTDIYAGGMLDRTGGHFHPLNLALGQAAALERLDGRVHEQTAVSVLDDPTGRPVLHTAKAVVRAETVVLAGNAYLGGLVPDLENRIMPFSTQMIATEPLSDEAASEVLPTDMCVEDVRYILDYYRLSSDRRLLFGGGTVYGGSDTEDIRAKLLPNMLKVFPQLKNVRIEHAWSGNCAISLSRVPQLGRLGHRTYFAHGYSGHGVAGSHLFGRILAEAIHGDRSRFDTFAAIPWLPFPGGRRYAVPYSVAGSWWYGLRDRLGI